MTFRKWMIFILGFAGAVVPGRASLSFYNAGNESTFNSAVSSLTPTTIDLLTLTSTASGLMDSATGVTFQDYEGGSNNLSVRSCTSPCSEGSIETTFGSYMFIVLPSTYTAISFNFFEGSSGGYQVSFLANGASEISIDPSNGSPQFVGLATGAISGLTVSGPQTDYQLDDVTVYSQASGGAVPEGSTFLLFGFGLILLGFLGRFRRAAALS